MTTLTLPKTLLHWIPPSVKSPLRRRLIALRPDRLLRTILYRAGYYRITGAMPDGIHLGCGNLRIDGFWNIDKLYTCDCDIVAGVQNIPLKSNSVGAIYNAHVFEHLPRVQSMDVLREWYRVLRPGGKLYLACPDIEALAQMYLKYIDAYETDEGRSRIDLLTGIIYGGQDYRFNFHYSGWSFPTLSTAMREVGFQEIKRFQADNLPIRDFRDASYAEMDGVPLSLNLEAIK